MNIMNFKKLFIVPIGIVTMMNLLGCAAMHTSISKQDLEVQTRMSHTIFLEPTTQENKRVFIQVRNTSGKNTLNMQNRIALALVDKGYTIVNDPKKANYIVQTNVLRITKANRRDIDSAFDAGFSGALMGGTLAAVAGGDDAAILGLGLAGSMVGVAIDAMVKDVYFTIITDLQISERSTDNVHELNVSNLVQGSNSRKVQASKNQNHWKKYQTRIISTANKVNLKFEEANPILVAELVSAISGMM